MALSPPHLDRLTRAALFQARRNLGQTWPNPSVGAVVADRMTGEIYASAVTAAGGRPHAEVLALRAAGCRARGSLLAVTLEPCSHHGVTPPCADAIVEAGVAAVAYGTDDPDSRVAGRGLARLRAAGVEVIAAPFQQEADWLNLGHSLRVTEGRPFVQMKAAVDAGGFVAAGTGKPVWVTGEEARAYAHLLRARTDAIVVGANTVRHDDPSLTCRLPGLEAHSPVRVVLSGSGVLPFNVKMLTDGGPPIWVIGAGVPLKAEVTGPAGSRDERSFFPSRRWPVDGRVKPSHDGINLKRTLAAETGHDGRIGIASALKHLAAQGITRVLVEGGPALWRAFLEAGFCDEAVVARSGSRISGGGASAKLAGGLENLDRDTTFTKVEEFGAGPDTINVFRARAHWKA